MTRYLMLECLIPEDKTAFAIRPHPAIEGIDSWLTGASFLSPPHATIELDWDPETSGVKKTMYASPMPLLRKDVFQVLEELGVDNIDAYPVEIRHADTGIIDKDYVAFNVLGAVMAADLSKSHYSDPSGTGRLDMDFDSLTIEPSKAQDLLFFRLAECVSGIVVHESVADGLMALGGFGLELVPPEEWVG
ncbi:hypothetical protein MYSTI_02690 [Myxococcus stipitatus DSM 14675]|uniref:Uncharacterized protein n=1 Tax=Myxococcus stipitatus (strain DSM 14675 / JCM 12634 / Mx s8) TaxID=1278073 RepID=L7U585_MYXSD|nr:hypothetical protein [Myxococcus stipitatus]AGC44006.1 hypothetical protein MYSTI_02690 [Myxococcus stipitatus DSM 14675]